MNPDERPFEDTARSSHIEPKREVSGEIKPAILIFNFLLPEL